MAGDWIKIRTDLYEDPDVMRLSDILDTDDLTTVGLLVRFWAWANKQTTDGTDIAISSARLDRLIGREGFAEGMRLIGWLSGRDGSLCLPRFERHNGNSAKARALEAEAKRLRRAEEAAEEAARAALSDNTSDKCRTPVRQNVGPEKRREDSLSSKERETRARPADAGGEIPEAERLDEISARVNSLHSTWARAPGFSAKERAALLGSFDCLASLDDEAWETLRAYMAARLPQGSPGWQPKSRAQFLGDPSDVLVHAESWAQKQRKAPPPTRPTGPTLPPDDPVSREELSEMFRELKPKLRKGE